jgi:hypothetical protein
MKATAGVHGLVSEVSRRVIAPLTSEPSLLYKQETDAQRRSNSLLSMPGTIKSLSEKPLSPRSRGRGVGGEGVKVSATSAPSPQPLSPLRGARGTLKPLSPVLGGRGGLFGQNLSDEVPVPAGA